MLWKPNLVACMWKFLLLWNAFCMILIMTNWSVHSIINYNWRAQIPLQPPMGIGFAISLLSMMRTRKRLLKHVSKISSALLIAWISSNVSIISITFQRECGAESATLLHLFWLCSHIAIFWSDFHSLLELNMEFQAPKTPEVCLLGFLKAFVLCTYTQYIFCLLLFYVRKSILLFWKNLSSPTIQYISCLINIDLPKY